MSFSISIGGDASSADDAEGSEQSLVDDLKTVLANHADKIGYASASMQYSGSRDLVAEISAGSTASTGTGAAGTPDTGSTAGTPDAGTPDVGTPDPAAGTPDAAGDPSTS